MTRTLLLACGNRLRRDDGVAHAALALLPAAEGCETRSVLQLTPELAAEIAGYDKVIFVDAALSAIGPLLEPLPAEPFTPPLTHVSEPGDIVALARALFAFTGDAYLCRIQAPDLSQGEGLSAGAAEAALQAAYRLSSFLGIAEGRE